MFPVIVCIAKKEKDYIEEFIKYHLKLGFMDVRYNISKRAYHR
jgi:hypothetical protein